MEITMPKNQFWFPQHSIFEASRSWEIYSGSWNMESCVIFNVPAFGVLRKPIIKCSFYDVVGGVTLSHISHQSTAQSKNKIYSHVQRNKIFEKLREVYKDAIKIIGVVLGVYSILTRFV